MRINDYIEITNEDNMELMKRYPDNYFDLAVVDPPYGIGAGGEGFKNGTSKNKTIDFKKEDWDNEIPNVYYWNELFRVSKNQIVWGGNYFTEFLEPKSSWIFWDKGTGDNSYSDGELAWNSFGGALRKITKSWVGANAKDGLKRIHPTQKPIYVYESIFKRFAKEGDKILDTHLGGGSIAIALDNVNKMDKMNLTLTACELDEVYFKNSTSWIKNETTWQSLF